MSAPRPFRLRTPHGPTLDGLVDAPDGVAGPRPVVVVCHGFKGFMEWGFFPALAALLAARGLLAVRFDFSGSGMRPGEDRVSDPAAFRDDTISRQLADLLAVVAGLEEIAGERADLGKLGLFGHSRGGAVALLAAAHPGLARRVGALVTWSAIARLDRWSAAEKAAWRRRGTLPVVNSRTGQELALGTGVLDDLEAHGEALDLAAAAGRRTAPWRIVHGDDDESVPVAEAEALAAAAAPPCELLRIPDADHTYRARHPFAGPTPQLVAALNATQGWFLRHLRG